MHIREQIRQAVAAATGDPLALHGEIVTGTSRFEVMQPSEEVETEDQIGASTRTLSRRITILARTIATGESVNEVLQATATAAVTLEAAIAALDISALADMVELIGTEVEILADEPKQTIATQTLEYVFMTRTLEGDPEVKV